MTATPPTCWSCNKPGRVWRRLATASGRLRLILICNNPACRFDFINLDGQPAKAFPKWSWVPDPIRESECALKARTP